MKLNELDQRDAQLLDVCLVRSLLITSSILY